jgi:hypothetical protein
MKTSPTETESAIALSLALEIIGKKIKRGSTGQLIQWLTESASPTIEGLLTAASGHIKEFWGEEDVYEVLIERAKEKAQLIEPALALKIRDYHLTLINRYSKGAAVA